MRAHAPFRSAADPKGSIVLGVAENRITSDLLHVRGASRECRLMEQGSGSRFAAGLERTGPAPHRRARLNLTAALTAAPTASGPPQARMSELGPFPQSMLTYQAWRGIPELGLALKSMLESTFMKVRQPAHAEDPSQGSPGARSPLPRGPPSKKLLPGAASQGPRREEVPSRGVGSNVAGGVAGASGQHGVTASQASLCPQRPTHNPGPQLDPKTKLHPRAPPPPRPVPRASTWTRSTSP
jgi:hypothetical protein